MWEEIKNNTSCLSGLGSSHWTHQSNVDMDSSCSHEHCYSSYLFLSLSTHQHNEDKKGKQQLYTIDLGLMKLLSGVFCVKEQARNTELPTKSTIAELLSSLIGVQSHYGLWVQDLK